MPTRKTPEERFWAKVDTTPGQGPTGTCLTWTGAKTTTGYGSFYVNGAYVLAHRYSLELATGEPIPDELVAMHECGNKLCVSPECLSAGTHSENTRHAIRTGALNRERCGKLVKAQVRAIRRALKGGASISQTARDFGVARLTVQNIHHRRTWDWLEDEDDTEQQGNTIL